METCVSSVDADLFGTSDSVGRTDAADSTAFDQSTDGLVGSEDLSNSDTLVVPDTSSDIGDVAAIDDASGQSDLGDEVSTVDLSDGTTADQILHLDTSGAEDLADFDVSSVDPTVLEITDGPPQSSGTSNAMFQFSCNGPSCGNIECKMDFDTWKSCASGVSYSDLSESAHTFYARATDSSGTVVAQDSLAFTVDLTPPQTILISVPPAESTLHEPIFQFDCNDVSCTFKCQIDDGPWQDCTSPYSVSVSAGDRTFRILATDAAGNVETQEKTVEWYVIAWKTVSASRHTCAISSTDDLYCWGRNSNGELGLADKDPRLHPTLVSVDAGVTKWKSVSTGYNHTIAITTTGSVYVWGSNQSGQIGLDGDTGPIDTPTPIPESPGPISWLALKGGSDYSCGIGVDNTLWCFGENSLGQLGLGDKNPRLIPTLVDTATAKSWLQVAVDGIHTCAIEKSTQQYLWCWGIAGLGQGDQNWHDKPVKVGDASWKEVVVGNGHTCALTLGGQLWCWGTNDWGALGTNDKDPRLIPTAVTAGPASWSMISARQSYTCGIDSDSKLWCWGQNDWGNLGVDDKAERLVPTQVTSDLLWAFVSAGPTGTCAIDTDGGLSCWGSNEHGQIGDGTSNTTRLVPTPVRMPND